MLSQNFLNVFFKMIQIRSKYIKYYDILYKIEILCNLDSIKQKMVKNTLPIK